MIPSHPATDDRPGDTRTRIIAAAAKLIDSGGADAATTRAVANAASVQAPTIYRLFGDKGGLLDAVAEQKLADYVAGKVASQSNADPVDALRQAWDTHIAFGLANPAIFALISTAQPGRISPATQAGLVVLRERVRRVARTGRLRVSEELAVGMIHAMGTGTVLALLQKPADEQEGLSQAGRKAVFAAIIDEQSPPTDTGPAGLASALRACVEEIAALSPGERHLLDELLQRISRSS